MLQCHHVGDAVVKLHVDIGGSCASLPIKADALLAHAVLPGCGAGPPFWAAASTPHTGRGIMPPLGTTCAGLSPACCPLACMAFLTTVSPPNLAYGCLPVPSWCLFPCEELCFCLCEKGLYRSLGLHGGLSGSQLVTAQAHDSMP